MVEPEKQQSLESSLDEKMQRISLNDELYSIVVNKITQFYESILDKKVTERLYFKLNDFSKLSKNIKVNSNFNKILFYENYSNVRCFYFRNPWRVLTKKTFVIF